MATIPRTYMMTSKDELGNIPLKNGQVISLWDSDEVYYDAPSDGTTAGTPVRRQISSVRIITTLPEDENPPKIPMEDILYVYIGDHGTLPESEQELYDLRIWVNNGWYIVGTNKDDANVKVTDSEAKFYLAGTSSDAAESIGSLLKNSNVYIQNDKIHGDLVGTADKATTATNATNATNATKAEKDINSNPLTGYLRSVSSNATTNLGSTITFTKGDGTITSVRVSDTTYNIYGAATAGLVNGTNTHVASDPLGLILSGSGWMLNTDITIGTATKALRDTLSQRIDTTYIKSVSYDTATELLTVTKGDGTTSTVSIPDTTYSVFNTTTDGLVPKASGSGDTAKYLRGDHTWQAIPNYIGATSGAAGTAGLVPPANSGDTTKYLRSDGTWNGLFGVGSAGLAPATASGDDNKFLKGNGTWSDVTANTSGSNQDTAKLYLVGTKSQTTGTAGVQTFSNSAAYTQNGKLYSNNDETVTLTGAQALTNKTYEGYTLADACSKNVASTIAEITTDNFTGDGSTTAFTLTNTAQSIYDVYIDGSLISSGYSLNTSTNTVTFTSAPANDADIIIDYYDAAYDANALAPAGAISSYLPNAVNTALNNSSLVDAGVIADIYDDSLSYTAGEYRTYKAPGSVYKLYKCNASTSGAFDPTKWDEVAVSDILVRVPAPPATDGTYTLKVTVSSGIPTFGWV